MLERRWLNTLDRLLNEFHLDGVGISNGAEAVLHSANRFLNEFHSDGSLAMLTVDFTNAFNLVDRSTLLREVRTRCLLFLCGWTFCMVNRLGYMWVMTIFYPPRGSSRETP